MNCRDISLKDLEFVLNSLERSFDKVLKQNKKKAIQELLQEVNSIERAVYKRKGNQGKRKALKTKLLNKIKLMRANAESELEKTGNQMIYQNASGWVQV